jgi:hypothetical protein
MTLSTTILGIRFECHNTECHYGDCHFSFVVMLSVVMLIVMARIYHGEEKVFIKLPPVAVVVIKTSFKIIDAPAQQARQTF